MSVTTQSGSTPRESAHAASPRESVWRVALASMVGTSIEWYDFFIYAQAAGLVLAPLFLAPVAESNPALAQILAFATIGMRAAGAVGPRSPRVSTRGDTRRR